MSDLVRFWYRFSRKRWVTSHFFWVGLVWHFSVSYHWLIRAAGLWITTSISYKVVLSWAERGQLQGAYLRKSFWKFGGCSRCSKRLSMTKSKKFWKSCCIVGSFLGIFGNLRGQLYLRVAAHELFSYIITPKIFRNNLSVLFVSLETVACSCFLKIVRIWKTFDKKSVKMSLWWHLR